jgi:hypothetical protein
MVRLEGNRKLPLAFEVLEKANNAEFDSARRFLVVEANGR